LLFLWRMTSPNLQVAFSSIVIFIISILLIHDHGRSLHLLVFSISFINVLYLSF
jgi:hypothetical protein